jgi:hypothetical protein
MTAVRQLETPAHFTSIHRLRAAATICREVARHTHPAVLDRGVRDELEHVAAGLDTIADRRIEVERIFRGDT